MTTSTVLTTEHAFTLRIDLAAPIEAGLVPAGHRRIIPIVGGSIDGPLLDGEVLPGGADWNTTDHEGTTHIWARYDLRTSDGAIIGIVNEGAIAAPADGAQLDLSTLVVVTRPTLDAPLGPHAWLNTSALAGVLTPASPTRVVVEIYRLLPEAAR